MTFLEIVWDKILILGLLAITLLVDLIWLIYWGPFWRSDVMRDWERGIHNFVIFMSIIGFLYKVSAEGINFRFS